MSASQSSHKWMVCLTVLLGAIMSAVDTSIVNVAIPYMRGNLGASVEEITWVASGYILATVVIMPIIAFLSARFGRKKFYMFSIFLFTASSMLCGLAWDLPSLIIFRIIQGIGGGVLMPMSQAILRETFSDKEQGAAMGIYGMAVVIGPAFGPALGGWLTDNFSWPWIFFINIPIGILNFIMASQYIQDPPFLVRHTGKVDWLGLFLMTLGLVSMQIVFEKGQDKGWFDSSLIVWFSITGAVSLIFFVWRELVIKHPVVDLSLFKDTNFTCGTLIGAVFGFCLYTTLFLQPLFLQQLGYTAYEAGMILIPRSLIMAVAMPVAGRLYNRWGARAIILIGLLITVGSYWDFSHLSLSTSGRTLVWPQILQGTGFGTMFVALSTVVLSTIPKPSLTAAVGLYNVIRQIAGSVGIAIGATLLTNGQIASRNVLVAHVTAQSPQTQHHLHTMAAFFQARGLDVLSAHRAALVALDQEVSRQAQMISFNQVFLLMAIVFVLSIPLIMTIKNTRFHSESSPVHEI